MKENIFENKTIIRNFRKSLNVMNEAMPTITYEEVMKAFFDTSYDSEKKYEVTAVIRDTLGDSFVKLVFAEKDNPEQLTKLVDTIVKTLNGTIESEVTDQFDVRNDFPEPKKNEPETEASNEPETEASLDNKVNSQSNSSDVGITVSTPNE